MKKYNYFNNLEKSFKNQWLIGIDQDKSALNILLNLIYYALNKKVLSPYFFVRLSVRGKLMLSLFYLIAFVLIPLGFILALFVIVFMGFQIFT